MRRIKVTYDVVTPESAQEGDYAETGWIDEEGVEIIPDEFDIEEHGSESEAAVALAVKFIGKGVEASDYPRCCPGHTWYTDIEGDTEYSTMAVTRQSYHLEGFDDSEQIAIYRKLVRS